MKIDVHLHAIGDGSSGSGCRLSTAGLWRRTQAKFLLKHLSLPVSLLSGGLDVAYAEKMRTIVKTSSIDKAVLLAHEETRDDAGHVTENFQPFFVPNDHVLNLAKTYPEEFLAGVSIHPARADAIDELYRCKGKGGVLVKFLPNCQNIDMSRGSFKKFWDTMALLEMPLLSHTGGELSIPVAEKKFEDPKYLSYPLERGVTVIAAHGSTGSHPLDKNYVRPLYEMASRFQNLFVDNSALVSPNRAQWLKKIAGDEFRDRIVYGSDLPIPISAWGAALWRAISVKKALAFGKVENPLERDIAVKRDVGFTDDSLTRASSLLPIARQ